MTIEPGSKWKRIEDEAEVTVRNWFTLDLFLLGPTKLWEYLVVEPEWREKGYATPHCLGYCAENVWAEHFVSTA